MRKRKGFTLAELLIVVAIIGVLVAIAIPVFTSSLEKAREGVCLSNRTSLLHEIIYQSIPLSDKEKEELLSNYGRDDIKSKGYVCPSDDLLISASYDKNTHQFFVKCDKHGGGGDIYNFAGTIGEYLKNEEFTKLIWDMIQHPPEGAPKTFLPKTDSTAPDGGFYAGKIQSYLEKATNYSLNTGMTKTWSMSPIYFTQEGKLNPQQAYQVYWSSADITQCKAGDEILVMRYNSNYAGKEAYIATWMKVEKEPGKDYLVLAQNSDREDLSKPDGPKDFDTAYKLFSDELSTTDNQSGIRKH